METRASAVAPWTAPIKTGHLKHPRQPQHLRVSGTAASDTGLSNLSTLTQLRDLHLSSDRFTDAGLAHLEGLTTLRVLSLGNWNITDAGLEHLRGLTELESLDLEAVNVTDEGIKNLQQALPNCRIKRMRADPWIVGRAKGMLGCRWAFAQSDARRYRNDPYPVREHEVFKMLSGLVEIHLDSGVTLTFQGRCEYQVEWAHSAVLTLGKVTTGVAKTRSCPADPVSFTISTPFAVVTGSDLEMDAEVDWFGNLRAHVFKGNAELRLPRAKARTM